jgi:hypothetical protein
LRLEQTPQVKKDLMDLSNGSNITLLSNALSVASERPTKQWRITIVASSASLSFCVDLVYPT